MTMGHTADMNPAIIEALYGEALLLADDVRAAFDLAPAKETGLPRDHWRIALSAEGLKATTRVMHVLAWLLNQRAYLKGDMTEFQLKRTGQLPPDRAPDSESLMMLEPMTRELIVDTQRLHTRVARLDAAWRAENGGEGSAVHRLRERLGRAVEGL
ncbi:DUF1465 family protein [Altererythrobacter sp. MTPC7]|uniref:DUF1465 family protein n=1 Tax=Altererythrobacter sp. MTPC7 TaxID=3056567 RepID=UPI0036F38F1E